jgi:hypothetical protein
MIVRDFVVSVNDQSRITSAAVSWEQNDYPEQILFFDIQDGEADDAHAVDEPCWDAFAAACFPLAAAHGEARLRIEGQPCPMLIEGLRTAYAWWESWGKMPGPAPVIETPNRMPSKIPAGPRQALSFLSGGVDGLHTLLQNRRLYRPEDAAYIRRVLFIHGFDIGKRARDPEHARYRSALQSLEPLAAEASLRIVPCRTNLRHFPSKQVSGSTGRSGLLWPQLVMRLRPVLPSFLSEAPTLYSIPSRQARMRRSTRYSRASG